MAVFYPELATRPADFIQSIGVVTHLELPQSSYGDTARVGKQLSYLGINRIRTAPGTSPVIFAAEKKLAAMGIKFDMLVMSDISRNMAAIDALAPYVISVEGPNEVDITPVNYNGLSGAAAAIAFQERLYAAVHSDLALNRSGHSTPVLGFTVSLGKGSQPYQPYGDMSRNADYINVHAYGDAGIPPQWFLQPEINGVPNQRKLQAIVTETGQNTMPGTGTSEIVQAKLILNTVLDNFLNGVHSTYIYELQDEYEDKENSNLERHYGLFKADGEPKLAAVAIHNLTSILSEHRPTTTLTHSLPAQYNITGLLPRNGGSQILLRYSDGGFALVLWQEPRIWDSKNHIEIKFDPTPISIDFGTSLANVDVYDPHLGNNPFRSDRNVSTLHIALGSGPLIIKFAR